MAGQFLLCQEELNCKESRHVGAYDRDTPAGRMTEALIWMGLMDSCIEMHYILKAWREDLNETHHRTKQD